jgi:hypothetical protein
LENILTSFEGSLSGITEKGVFEFWEDKRTAVQKERLEVMQQAVLDYIEDSAVNLEMSVYSDVDVVDLIFYFLSSGYCEIKVGYLNGEEFFDEFCNRKFDLKEK